jgi:hypothetical protein
MNNFKLNITVKSFLFGLIGLTTLATSCKDVLDENPKSIVAEVFYNTPAEVEAGVNAIYSPLRSVMPEYTATLEAQSDFGYGRGSWEPLSLYQGFNDANITRVIPFWNWYYTAIRNANLVIKNAPNGTDISQAEITKYVGESKFLRALAYFQLVRNWGSVPLRTEDNMTQRDLAKSPVNEIYDLIVADLIAAEAALPDNPAAAGRPTKWAAKTVLADVYLQLGRYGEAATKSGEVIQSNKYSLVRVNTVADFQNNIYGPTLLTSTEEVFYFKYSRLANEGNYFLFIVNHPSTGLYNITGAYAIHSDRTNPIYVNWDSNDLRKSLFNNVNFGLGANTLVTAKFSDKAAISNRGAGNDHPLYRYADVLLIYAEAASRAENSVSHAALEALNKVRRRAYKFDPAVPSSVDYTSADYATTPFLDLVMKERVYEFNFEGKRWLELKRTGRAQEFVTAHKNKTIAAKHLLWPIPVGELDYNEALDPATDQNPGY